jgi:trehalose-phosphatase
LELRIHGINKGEAMRTILAESPLQCVCAYLGDDTTDEEVFAVLGERGLKVLVRAEPRPTLADVCLRPPEELCLFLDRWTKDEQ